VVVRRRVISVVLFCQSICDRLTLGSVSAVLLFLVVFRPSWGCWENICHCFHCFFQSRAQTDVLLSADLSFAGFFIWPAVRHHLWRGRRSPTSNCRSDCARGPQTKNPLAFQHWADPADRLYGSGRRVGRGFIWRQRAFADQAKALGSGHGVCIVDAEQPCPVGGEVIA